MASSQEALLPAAAAAGDNVAENALSPFVFEPLLAGPCTRLLTLNPGTGHGPLTGSMSVHPLRGRRRMPSYHALSYCWGEESERTQEILINGMTYMITTNAHNALAHSRSPEEHVTLWIDQICINQEDLDEKSRHIGYMGAIYREAHVVVAYLGEETEGVDVLFAFMNTLEYEYRNAHIWWKKWRMRRAPADWALADVFRPGKKLFPRTEARLRKTFAQEDAVLFHNARMELLARPWFRRMWIVQEAGLARRLLVRVGPHTAGWEGLMDVVHELIYAWPGARTMDVVTGFKSAMAINMLIREIKQPPSWTDVWHRSWHVLLTACRHPTQLSSSLNEARTRYIPTLPLLRQFRHQLAGDASDKIFALAGLAHPSDSDRFLRHAGYGRTVAQNCFYFALAHVVQTGTLDVLAATCLGARAHEVLPSWCPDWSQETPFCDTGYALSSYRAPPHGAGMRFGVTVDLLEGTGWAVVVLGVEFDVVASVVGVGMTIDEFDNPADPVWAAWNEFALEQGALVSSPYISAEDRWDAYWRTLAYNSSGGGGGRFADASLGDVFRSFLDGTLADRKRWTGRLVFKGRRLYRTRRGYLGNGCDQVRAGDKIYVCHGARFPLLLREGRAAGRGAGDGAGDVGGT